MQWKQFWTVIGEWMGKGMSEKEIQNGSNLRLKFDWLPCHTVFFNLEFFFAKTLHEQLNYICPSSHLDFMHGWAELIYALK